jgi:uncharacterized PurR-regulated membrane protein YhhQ (DUF165 family)
VFACFSAWRVHPVFVSVSLCDGAADSGCAGVGVIVSAYEPGVGAGRRATRLAAGVASHAARRLRTPTETIGRAHVSGPTRPNRPGLIAQTVTAILRLVLPVVFLLVAGAACAIYSDAPAAGLGSFAGRPLSIGLALLPVTFFVIQLTNRRYGAAYAYAQIAIAWTLALIALPSLVRFMSPAPDARVVAAFGAALLQAQLTSVLLFDRLRGPIWWKAPLIASLVSGLLFCLVAFPLAFGGADSNWSREMFDYMELAAGAAVLLLIPYGVLRSRVPPLSGLGGY